MRILRYFLVTLLSLVVLVFAVIALALNFVFTPAKLSPVIEEAVNENLNASLSLASVELTFFSSFPNFSVVVNDGALQTLQNDTIVSFDKLNVVVNPIALLRDNRVVVRRVELVRPVISALIDADGKANWDVAKSSEEEVQEIDSVSVQKKSLSISLSDIRIVNGTIILDDRVKKVYGELKNVNLTLDGNFAKKLSDVKFAMSFTDGLFWQDGKVLLKRVNFATNASAELNTQTKYITIKSASVELNTVEFDVAGAISPDSIDMALSLKVPKLDSLLGLVSFIDSSAKVSTTGSVSMNATIKGAYKGENSPVVDVILSIDKGSLHYEGYENGIENLNVNASAHLDMKGNSTLTIDNFNLLGVSTSINFSGEVNSLFSNPVLTYSTNSTINYTELAATFPLKEGVEIAGRVRLNSRGTVSESQLRSGDYAHISADGEIKLADVVFNVPDKINSKFKEADIALSNTKEGLLHVTAMMNGVSVSDSVSHLSLDSLSVVATGQEKTGESFLEGTFNYANLRISLRNDTLALASGHSAVSFKVNQTVDLSFQADTLRLRAVDNEFNMSRARVNVTAGKDLLKGRVAFRGVSISVPKFPLPMSMPATVLSVNNHKITLRKAAFKIGNSDVEMDGFVENLISAASGELPLTMRVNVNSSMLNLTEIAHALNQLTPAASEAETEVADTSTLQLFKIPKNIDFEMDTNFKHVEFGALLLDNVHGVVTLKNGVARLKGLSMEMLDAKLATTVVYDSSADEENVNVGLIMGSKSIDVHSVIKLIPSLDTLMPMLNSFEGKLNFKLAANTKFYPGFTIHPTEIQATIGLQGEDLVLLDGQTFSEISKLLMFKNKKRNVVDSIGVQMAVTNGAVEVFPFLIQIDRYRAAIGGEHYLTNNFNYHISILKSPVPFKFGVNISGSLDDIKVGIGKTKYKSLNQPSSVRHVNPKYVELGKEIEAKIRKL